MVHRTLSRWSSAQTLVSFALLIAIGPVTAPAVAASRDTPARVLRILPLGDSITRGSYVKLYQDGPYQGKAIGVPHSDGGGYRKPLQDRLRAAGIAFDFVGELSYGAYGRDGGVDAAFDPNHHGLAGFSNARILSGGVVPTPNDVLQKLGVKQIEVPGIEVVLQQHRPDIILLLSGANGFDAPARDQLIQLIGDRSPARLLVATLLPQRPPRAGWENVEAYNRSLPAVVRAQQAAGKSIALVDLHAVVSPDDLLPDGVHPNANGMKKMAEAWFRAIQATEL